MNEELSDCCGAPIIWSDICSECKEHCGVHEPEEEAESPLMPFIKAMNETYMTPEQRRQAELDKAAKYHEYDTEEHKARLAERSRDVRKTVHDPDRCGYGPNSGVVL